MIELINDIISSLTVKLSSVKIKSLDQIKVEKERPVATGDVVKETTDNNKVGVSPRCCL